MRMTFSLCSVLAGVALFAATVSGIAFGQGGTTTATVAGTVQANTGLLPGATVELTSLDTAERRTAITDGNGNYKFSGIAPGRYSLSAELSGFSKFSEPNITVNIGQALNVEIKLQVGSLSETVTVTDQPSLIQPSTTNLSSVINGSQLAALPTLNRNYMDFVLQTPSAAQNTSTSQQGLSVNIAGARAKEAALLVDGFWNTDESFTYPRQLYSVDSIQEYQVVALAGTAEFGRAIGGIISAITRSGGNKFHGAGYGYFRNKWMEAEDPLSLQQNLPKPDFSRYLYGGRLGGPIFRDKTYFFGAGEGLQQATPQPNGITPATQQALGLATSDAGNINATLNTKFIMGKVDHTINENNAVGFSFAYTSDSDFSTFLAFATPSRRNRLTSQDYSYQARWTHIAHGGNWLQDLKGSYFPRNYVLDSPNVGGPPLAADGQLRSSNAPSVNITNVAMFGFGGIQLAQYTKPGQITYSSTISKGKHDIKFGYDGMFVDFVYDKYTGPQTGTYSFTSLAAYEAGKYSTYTENFGGVSLDRFHTYASFYAQDSWKVTPKLTMNYGLRYDVEWLSKFQGINYGHDSKDVGPRLALSYDLFGNNKTILKVSNGLIYDRIFQNPITPTFFSAEGVLVQATAQYSYGAPGAPIYPNTLPNASPNGLPLGTRSVYVTPPNLAVPRSYQVIGSVDQAIGKDFSITLTGMFDRSWHKEYLFDTNEVFDGSVFVRPNPTYLHIYQYIYGGKAQYSGLAVTTHYVAASRVFFTTSTTYARAYDQGDNFNVQTNDLRNPASDYAPAIDTPTLRFAANGAYSLPWHLQASGLFSAQTGIRYSAYAPGTFSYLGDNHLGDRVSGTTRDQFMMPGTSSLDLRLRYSPVILPKENVRAEFTAELFNTFNRSNVQLVNTTWGTDASTPLPTFGQPQAYYNSRQLQLGMRVEF